MIHNQPLAVEATVLVAMGLLELVESIVVVPLVSPAVTPVRAFKSPPIEYLVVVKLAVAPTSVTVWVFQLFQLV